MPRLVPLAGPHKGQPFELHPGDRIGRGADCAVRLVHASVSREHARIEREGDAWFVVDTESRNGILVRSERKQRVAIEDGLRLRFGEYPVRFEADGPGAADMAARASEDLADDVLDEELEFLDAVDPAAGRTEVRPREGLPAHQVEERGLELEDPAEIELAAPEAPPRPAPTPAGTGALADKADLVRGLQAARGGLLRGDLTQQPFFVQALVWIGVSALGLGMAWLVFSLVRSAA